MAVRKIKAEVRKGPKRKSKGAYLPWEVWAIETEDQCYHFVEMCKTEAEARRTIKRCPDLIAPVIVHIKILPMEY